MYATGTHIIVTIPSGAPTAAASAHVPSLIRLITDHGTGTYTFTLYLPPPVISSITLDNSATIVTINGSNLQGVRKITFPVTGNDTALSYTVNKTFTQIIAAIPAGVAFTDSLRVYCTYGVASFPYPPPMTVSSVSNENALAGTTLTVTGTNLIGINKVIFPGGIEGTDLKSVSVTELTVTVPAGITAPDSLRLDGVLGMATAPQLFDSYLTHPSPGYLSTFETQNTTDNTGFLGWTGSYASPATNYPNATGSATFFNQGSPMPANTAPGSQGNASFIQLNDVPWVANTGIPVAGYSLKFELYVAKPWSAGALWIMMGDWYQWHDYLARYAPWESTGGNAFQPSGWITVTIPLTQFLTMSGSGVTVQGAANPDNNAWDYQGIPVGWGVCR